MLRGKWGFSADRGNTTKGKCRDLDSLSCRGSWCVADHTLMDCHHQKLSKHQAMLWLFLVCWFESENSDGVITEGNGIVVKKVVSIRIHHINKVISVISVPRMFFFPKRNPNPQYYSVSGRKTSSVTFSFYLLRSFLFMTDAPPISQKQVNYSLTSTRGNEVSSLPWIYLVEIYVSNKIVMPITKAFLVRFIYCSISL